MTMNALGRVFGAAVVGTAAVTLGLLTHQSGSAPDLAQQPHDERVARVAKSTTNAAIIQQVSAPVSVEPRPSDNVETRQVGPNQTRSPVLAKLRGVEAGGGFSVQTPSDELSGLQSAIWSEPYSALHSSQAHPALVQAILILACKDTDAVDSPQCLAASIARGRGAVELIKQAAAEGSRAAHQLLPRILRSALPDGKPAADDPEVQESLGQLAMLGASGDLDSLEALILFCHSPWNCNDSSYTQGVLIAVLNLVAPERGIEYLGWLEKLTSPEKARAEAEAQALVLRWGATVR